MDDTTIHPFRVYIHEDESNQASLLLTDFNEKEHIFAERADEGWEGGGYGWNSVAQVVLEERTPELIGKINFDPEGSMFAAYGEVAPIKLFAAAMKAVYDDDAALRDVLSRAELD